MNNQAEEELELALVKIRDSIISSYGEHLSGRDVHHLVDSFTIQHRFVIDKSFIMVPEGAGPKEYQNDRCELCLQLLP